MIPYYIRCARDGRKQSDESDLDVHVSLYHRVYYYFLCKVKKKLRVLKERKNFHLLYNPWRRAFIIKPISFREET